MHQVPNLTSFKAVKYQGQTVYQLGMHFSTNCRKFCPTSLECLSFSDKKNLEIGTLQLSSAFRSQALSISPSGIFSVSVFAFLLISVGPHISALPPAHSRYSRQEGGGLAGRGDVSVSGKWKLSAWSSVSPHVLFSHVLHLIYQQILLAYLQNMFRIGSTFSIAKATFLVQATTIFLLTLLQWFNTLSLCVRLVLYSL